MSSISIMVAGVSAKGVKLERLHMFWAVIDFV